ncbi:hypothetical protein B0H14DRAFT_2233745, partial [Mycena olivaceomarginata]
IKHKYAASIRELSQKKNGWHFDALHAKAAQLESFHIEDIAREIRVLAPELWELVGLMLSADQQLVANEEDDIMISVDEEPSTDPRTRAEKTVERRDALISIKRVMIISMMMQSTNQKCNAVESVFGIFLHASNTP